MQRQNWLLLLIIGLVVASIVILIKLPLQLGLDLRGGSQLTIQVKPTETVKTIQPNDLKAVHKYEFGPALKINIFKNLNNSYQHEQASSSTECIQATLHRHARPGR
jgi:preprotein translocase subunit SecF